MRYLLAVLTTGMALAQTGAIIPMGHEAPDSSILSIESMDVHVDIDNGHAKIDIREVFRNATWRVQEGTYQIALPAGAAVSDFAVWDGLTRIPGVILERKRAEQLYEQIRAQAIDPGLLETSEVSESQAPGQARHSTAFTVKIVPIPGMGFKRVEASYRQTIPVNQLGSNFVLPLTQPMKVHDFTISVRMRSALPVKNIAFVNDKYWIKTIRTSANEFEAGTTLHDVALSSDVELRWEHLSDTSPRVTAYRDAASSDPGYFEADAILPPQPAAQKQAKTVLILFDASLSMQWEKLERNWQALDAILRSLQPADRFNVLVFNSQVTAFSQTPQTAGTDATARALNFVRNITLSGGTRLDAALETAFQQAAPNSYVVVLSDGEATEGVINPNKLAAKIERSWNALPSEWRPHIYGLAIGDDANISFMRRLAAHAGVFEQVNSTEPMDFKLKNFVAKIGAAPLQPVSLSTAAPERLQYLYRLEDDNFSGAKASWVGEYLQPGPVDFTVQEAAEKKTLHADLPQNATEHSYLPVTWARARVDALLEKINREGEDKASIEEIIRLSRKYHFVTPYTSFLAAPRALLRPRLIRPGDPMLRVRTDPSITSVIALFPFGLTERLRYLNTEDIWQTRFDAPSDLKDGTYTVRLILRDKSGHVYQEQKSFVLSSDAPVVRVSLASHQVHAGSVVQMRVQASATTRTIMAQLYGAPPVYLRWHEADKSNTGALTIPSGMPPGTYSVHIVAEDIAHNVTHQEASLEVLP